MRTAVSLAILIALGSPARAGGDVGVIVTGEGSMQPQIAAQIESWLSQHGHTPVPSPLPPEAVPLLVDCLLVENQPCAQDIFEQRAKSKTMLYAHLEAKNNETNGTRDVTLTAYWFDKGRDAVTQSQICRPCTDQSLRATADDVMKKLLGEGEVGHVKFKSAPPGARITIDGQPIGVTPLDWDLPPGKHTIQMDKAGFEPQTRELIVVSNKTELFGMKLVPPGDDHPGALSRLLPIGLLGAGGALLITGGAMIAIDQDPDPDLGPTIRNTGPTGVGLAIGGAIVAGVGSYLMWFRSPKTPATPVAAFTSDTAYIGWLGRF